MAVKLQTVRNTFLQAVSEFPRWMSIRKRPEKAVSGLFLQAVIDEQTDIVEELNKFIKEFFLISYVGKESTIASYVDIIQTGIFDYENATMIKPLIDITIDPKVFLSDMDSYALYQDGYLIISINNEPSDNTLLYTVNGYKYGGKLERYHIWNIFDEFAMFLGLERFVDTSETNEQLLKRCFLVFGNPANSTRQGLQNAVMNCLSNDIKIEREDVKVEIPDDSNVWLPYGDSTVYEYFVNLNKDIFRTKIWDLCWWEHNFKQLDYLSNKWDAYLDVYQDGTGQRDDLKTFLSQGDYDTTDVTVRGFKYSEIQVNDYCRKQRPQDTLSLSLIRYHDFVNPKHIQYTITAAPAIQLNTENIFLSEAVRREGVKTFYLHDIVEDTDEATVINPGAVKEYYDQNKKSYYLKFQADGDYYSDMEISKIVFYDGVSTIDLISSDTLTPDISGFKKENNKITYAAVVKHTSTISELKSSSNLTDIANGFTLSKGATEGSFTLDVTGCKNKTLRIVSEGRMFDLTEQTDRWTTLSRLKLDNGYLISDTIVEDNGKAVLEIHVMAFSVRLVPSDTNQGTCKVEIYVNDKLERTFSQLIVDELVQYQFDVLSKVKIVFTKKGSYPFSVEVRGTKYEIRYSLTHGELTSQLSAMVLPDVLDSVPNTLTVTVVSYDTVAPVIRYVHIGPSAKRFSYKTNAVTARNNSAYFDIDTVCKVSLYKDGTNELLEDNFVTKKTYSNETAENVRLKINTAQFTKITSSSVPIKKTVQAGKTVSYVTLQPGQTMSSIVIGGVISNELGRYDLDTLLGILPNYNVYVSKDVNGFVVRNPTTEEEWLMTVNRSKLSDLANTFTYSNLPEGVTGVFVTDIANDVKLISDSANRNFDCTFLQTTSSQVYIAHNELDIYKNITGVSEDIEIIDSMFYPVLPANVSMVYNIVVSNAIDDDTNTIPIFKKTRYGKSNYFCVTMAARSMLNDILALIEEGATSDDLEGELSLLKYVTGIELINDKNLFAQITELLYEGSWCLWKKEICFITDFNFNNEDTIAYDVNILTDVFSLSSTIALPSKVVIDDEEEDIGCFIVKPPSYLKVQYSSEYDGEATDQGYIPEDGFTKLSYSNVKEIVGITVDDVETKDYELLSEEGIIIWHLQNSVSVIDNPKKYQVTYLYKIPVSLAYKDLSFLYDVIPKSLNAYESVSLTSTIPSNLKDGDTVIVTFEEDVDYVPEPECSNRNFRATYNEGVVTVLKVYNDNVVLINAGYYYDDDKEYYMFNHLHSDIVDQYNHTTLHNVKRLANILQTMISSNNRIRRSDFKGRYNYDELCAVDFTDPVIGTKGFSLFDEMTAAQSYSTWQNYKMNVSFVAGIKDIGLLFTAEDSNSFAVTDISKYVAPSVVISAFTAQGITLEIYREIKMDDDVAKKTVFAEPYGTFITDSNFQGYHFEDDTDLSYRYYLVVKGTGIVDDIVARAGVSLDNQIQLHVKNIEHLGLNIVEKETTGNIVTLTFDTTGCNFAGLEMASDGTILMGSNVDYGVTRVFNSQDHYEDITADTTVNRYRETFTTAEQQGWIRTPFFFLENSANAVDIYVKINSLISGSLKNFDVKLNTADDETGTNMINTGHIQKTNLAYFEGVIVKDYVNVEVRLDPNKIVDTVEMFVRYGERGIVPLSVWNNTEGYLTTKVYDVVNTASYRVVQLTGSCSDIAKVKISVRGCRKDNLYLVWTQWYELTLNNDLVVANPHIFNDYRLFQFKIELLSEDATVNIKNFVLEVV